MDIKLTWKERLVEVLKEANKPLLSKEFCEAYYRKYPTDEPEFNQMATFRYNLSIAVKHKEISKSKIKRTYNYYSLPTWQLSLPL